MVHRWVGNTLVKSTAMVGLSIFEGIRVVVISQRFSNAIFFRGKERG